MLWGCTTTAGWEQIGYVYIQGYSRLPLSSWLCWVWISVGAWSQELVLFTEGKQCSSERQGLAAPAELRAEPSLLTGSILPPWEAESAELPCGSVLNGSRGKKNTWAMAGVWHVAVPPLCPDESPGCSFAARSCIVLPTLPLFCRGSGLFLIVTSLLFALRSPVDKAERTRSAYSGLGWAPGAGRYLGMAPHTRTLWLSGGLSRRFRYSYFHTLFAGGIAR